ncbi:MAG TPA: hypothetical protein VKE69_08995 [Planctomycetota bacterium]|nr:hypothetical protein [Planctomycetota bacterium]
MGDAPCPRSRRALRAAVVLLASTALALAALEVGLRIAAALAPGARPEPSPDGRPVVLFVGDSHTYGMNVEAGDSMPAQAEAVSRACAPPGFGAVNRGRIASPSWVALDEARESIARYRPVAVVARVGINNRLIGPPEEAGWLDGLRIVRVARIGLRNWADFRASREPRPLTEMTADGSMRVRTPVRGEGGSAQEFVSRPVAPDADYVRTVRPRLRADLVAIAREAERAGARTVFATYFPDAVPFALPNEDLAWAARETGAAFADVASVGRRAIAARPRSELVFFDEHVTPLAYALEAREVVRALREAGAIVGASPDDPIAWLASRPTMRPEVELALERDAWTLVVRSKPARNGSVILGRPGPPAQTLQGLPIADDELARSAAASDALKFSTDAKGEARVPIAPALAGLPDTARAVAVVVVPAAAGEPAMYYASEPVDFRTRP